MTYANIFAFLYANDEFDGEHEGEKYYKNYNSVTFL